MSGNLKQLQATGGSRTFDINMTLYNVGEMSFES